MSSAVPSYGATAEDTKLETSTSFSHGTLTSISSKEKTPISKRQDFFVWLGGLAFIVALIGAIFGFGGWRGWDADSGYTHNSSATSAIRFWSEPMTAEPGVHGRYGVDATGRWYYWKLPPDRVTPLTRGIMWFCYVLHNLLFWFGLYKLQALKMEQRSSETTPDLYSCKLGPWNWFMFGINVIFHLVHLGQTHWTYDALAQDVSISSSQSSVIMLLIFIMVLEYRDRGLFFGWPSQFNNGKWSRKLTLPYSPMYLVRRYHGYAFSWAAIYTFWYHPMENTWGHVFGFFHTYIILLQGCLAYTPFHLNKYWRFLLEVWVTAHGGVVAAQTGGPEMMGTKLWPMFVFGFLLIIVLTQLYGLPFWRKIPGWVRIFPLLVYLGVVIYMYSWIPDSTGAPWVRIQEIIRIPGVYYLYFFLVWGWTLILLTLRRCSISSEDGQPQGEVNIVTKLLCLAGIVVIYALFVAMSAIFQVKDVQFNMIALMIVLTGLFSLGCCVTNILFQIIFRCPPLSICKNQVSNIDIKDSIVKSEKQPPSTQL